MPDSTAALPRTIQQLLDQRDSHSKALTEIEATLARVSAAIGGTATAKVSGSKAAVAPAAKATKASLPSKVASAQTGNEFILGFVKTNKNPTSQQINAAWKASGRNRNADINLSLLTKAKKLKRTPLGAGMRGSTYAIA